MYHASEATRVAVKFFHFVVNTEPRNRTLPAGFGVALASLGTLPRLLFKHSLDQNVIDLFVNQKPTEIVRTGVHRAFKVILDTAPRY